MLELSTPVVTLWEGILALPLIGTFELATAMLFDVGVAMTVIGAVMLALAELSHVAQRVQKEPDDDEGPMDIDPATLRGADT